MLSLFQKAITKTGPQPGQNPQVGGGGRQFLTLANRRTNWRYYR